MKLQLFISKSMQEPLWNLHHKICFIVDAQVPILFFSRLRDKIRKDVEGSLEYIDLSMQEQSTIMSNLETIGFLSHKSIYWLGSIHGLSIKKRTKWLEYSENYHGQHSLVFCINQSDAAFLGPEWLCVTIPPTIERGEIELLAQFFHPEKVHIYKRLMRQLSPYHKFSLDQATLLIQYGQVIGSNVQRFFKEWLPLMIDVDYSLFKVSEYFLSGKSKEFFRLWSQVGPKYPQLFWVSYWSDITWRAYHYSKAMRRHDSMTAKRMSFKLPFSFIKSEWKRVDPERLKWAHQFIYNLDYKLKNGSGNYGLELLYAKFFLGQIVDTKIEERKNEKSRNCLAASAFY